MKPSSFVYIAAVTLFCGSVMPIAAAQTDRGRTAPKHHHYQPIDMGTFGGPASSTVPLWLGTLNSHGMTIGWSATSTPVVIHPGNPFICGGLDAVVPYVTHAFQWNGSVTDLGALQPGDDNCSLPFWVSDDGAVVGTSEDQRRQFYHAEWAGLRAVAERQHRSANGLARNECCPVDSWAGRQSRYARRI